MVKVILGDSFDRIVKRGETIWPHSSHPPKPPPVPADDGEEPPVPEPEDEEEPA